MVFISLILCSLIVEGTTHEAPARTVGRLADPPGRVGGEVESVDLVEGVGEQGADSVQFNELEVVELGVEEATLDEPVHGPPELGLADVPDVPQHHPHLVRPLYVLLSAVQDQVGHHEDVGGRHLREQRLLLFHVPHLQSIL